MAQAQIISASTAVEVVYAFLCQSSGSVLTLKSIFYIRPLKETMKVVVQRVTKASLTVDGQLISSIGRGIVVLAGLRTSDTVVSHQSDRHIICY